MLHRYLLVRDNSELDLMEILQIVRETVDIRVIERRLDLIENAERRRFGLEYRKHQCDRCHRLFAARHQIDILQLLARRLRNDLNTCLQRIIFVVEPQLRLTAAEQFLEDLFKMQDDLIEILFKLDAYGLVHVCNDRLQLLHGF